MSDSLVIPKSACMVAGAFVAGAGLIGGLWAWTSRTPMPPPPPSETIVLWPAEPQNAAPAQPDPVVEPAAEQQATPMPELATPIPTATEPEPSLEAEPEPEAGPSLVPAPEPAAEPVAEPVAEPEAVAPTEPRPVDPKPVAPAVQLIGINSAGLAELQLLPGIGPVLAGRIVDDRAANGRFGSLNDLQRVKGIGLKTAAKLAPLITFN
ncbi:MAG: competence protein ComEA [Phycisphaerales bacterium]